MIASKGMQILFQGSIDNFSLTIRLRMVTRTHAKHGSLQLKKSEPKIVDEYTVSVANDGSWHPMEFYHMIHEGFNNLQSIIWMG